MGERGRGRGGKVDQEIEQGVQDRAVGLALKIVERALSGTMKSALHEKLVDELLSEVEGLDVGHVPDEIREVEVVHPGPLSPDRKKQIREILEKKLGRGINLKEAVKKEMVGGLSLKLGSLVLDGSLENVFDGVARDLKKQM